jgi:hypothetical protein
MPPLGTPQEDLNQALSDAGVYDEIGLVPVIVLEGVEQVEKSFRAYAEAMNKRSR